MPSHLMQAWLALRHPIRGEAPRRAIARLAFLGCLPFCLLILASGCTQRKTSIEHAQVTGTVTYKGHPLPGGRVEFVAVEGAFASTAIIDENGKYDINAPVGPVKIAVDNRMIKPQRGGKREPAHLRRPGAENPDASASGPEQGVYEQIPSKYYSTDESELTYTVVPGPQTHEITLK